MLLLIPVTRCTPSAKSASALLDDGVLLAGIALPGDFDKRGDYNLALIEREALAVKILTEPVEQGIEGAGLAQPVFYMPHGFLVRYLIDRANAKELAKTGAVNDLVLDLLVAQAIII